MLGTELDHISDHHIVQNVTLRPCAQNDYQGLEWEAHLPPSVALIHSYHCISSRMSDVEGVIGHNRPHSQIFEIDLGSPEEYRLDKSSIGNMQALNVDASHEMVCRMDLTASYLQESHSYHEIP